MSQSETAKRNAMKSTLLIVTSPTAVVATVSLASAAPVYLDLKTFFDNDVLQSGGAGLALPLDATRNWAEGRAASQRLVAKTQVRGLACWDGGI
jgi:hypothetical protein